MLVEIPVKFHLELRRGGNILNSSLGRVDEMTMKVPLNIPDEYDKKDGLKDLGINNAYILVQASGKMRVR